MFFVLYIKYMPELENPRHEAFSKEWVTNGFNGSKAYTTVYGVTGDTADVNGSKLLTNTKIKARIEELKAENGKRHNITVETLIADLNHAQELASQQIHGKNQNNYDITNMIKAISEKAKLCGLYAPTRTENETKISTYTIKTNLDEQ